MALDAILAVNTSMLVILLVAGITSSGSAFEYLAHMAGGTIHCYMFPGQRKYGFVVVDSYLCPIGRIMALDTILAVAAGVYIVFLMTGKASL